MFLLLVYDSLDVTESDSGIGKSLAPTPEFSTKKIVSAETFSFLVSLFSLKIYSLIIKT